MFRFLKFLLLPVLVVAGLYAAPPASAAAVNGGTLVSGTPVTATIAAPGGQIQYSFPATAGHHVTFDVSSTNWGTGGSATLLFYNPAGAQYTYCYLYSSPTGCDFTPNADGTWTLLVAAASTSTGSARITFANDQTRTVSSGTAVTTAIALRGQHANYVFSATNGKHITFDISATNWGSGGSATLLFYNPSGNQYTYCYLYSSATGCDFTPNATGTWTATLVPAGLSLGAVTLTFANDQTTGTLVSGTPVTTTIRLRGQHANYPFAATNGKHVTFDIPTTNWGSGGSATLLFYNPSGNQYTYCYLYNATTECDFTPNATGTWTATLVPAGLSLGTVKIVFANDQNKGTVTPGTPVTTTIGIHGQRANYSYAAVNGVKRTFTVSATNWGSGGSATLLFYNAAGAQYTYCYLYSSPTSCVFTPNSTGTWTATLVPSGLSLGNVTFTLT